MFVICLDMAPKKFGNRLGIRQELGLDKPKAEPKAKARSSTGNSLVNLYASGKLSARDVGDVAASSTSSFEGQAPPDIERLKRAAAPRNMPPEKAAKNSSRSFMRALAPTIELPPEYTVKCPMWDKRLTAPRDSDLSILLPHEVLSTLCSDGNLEKFASYSDEQQGFKNELTSWGGRMGVDTGTGDWLTLGLWGDTAPSTGRDQLMLLSFMVLCGAVRQRIWIGTMNKSKICQCGCQGRHTFSVLFELVAYSAKALLLGRFPVVDHEGLPFTDPWRKARAGQPLGLHACFIAKYGDWAWLKQALDLRGWRGEGRMGKVCWMCPASLHNPDCYAYDFRAEAPWRSTTTTMVQFWEEVFEERRHISPIWSIPGFLTRYCIPDFMHVCCLGILQYLNGNCMWELFIDLGGTESRWKKACGALENMSRVAAKALGEKPPFNNLTIGMLIPTDKRPKMKLKAAEGRYFVKVLEYILKNLVACDTEHQKLRLHCVSALVSVYAEIKNWVSDGSSAARVADLGRRHLLLYRELHDTRASDRFWRIYPKHHIFAHTATRLRANPKLEWNYSDESEIGLGAAVAKTANQAWLETALIRRYRATFVRKF